MFKSLLYTLTLSDSSRCFQDAWETLKSDTERKRKLLVIIFPDWSKFYQTAHDLDMNLEAMDANIKVANINREIHKVRLRKKSQVFERP